VLLVLGDSAGEVWVQTLVVAVVAGWILAARSEEASLRRFGQLRVHNTTRYELLESRWMLTGSSFGLVSSVGRGYASSICRSHDGIRRSVCSVSRPPLTEKVVPCTHF
jgi:hypothetical protein